MIFVWNCNLMFSSRSLEIFTAVNEFCFHFGGVQANRIPYLDSIEWIHNIHVIGNVIWHFPKIVSRLPQSSSWVETRGMIDAKQYILYHSQVCYTCNLIMVINRFSVTVSSVLGFILHNIVRVWIRTRQNIINVSSGRYRWRPHGVILEQIDSIHGACHIKMHQARFLVWIFSLRRK